MKSSHSHCKRFYYTVEGFKVKQTTLMNSRQFYCTAKGFTAESFTAQQTTSMHSRKLYCTTGSFIAQQKVLLHSRKVSHAAETGEKFLLRQKLEKSSFCGRNWRKVLFAVETGEKFLLQQKQRTSTTFCPPQASSQQTRYSLRTSQTKLSCSWTGLNSLTQNTRAQYRRRQLSPL